MAKFIASPHFCLVNFSIMDKDESNSSYSSARREFLKGLVGLGKGAHGNDVKVAAAHSTASASFWWADLKTGQIGFPTGIHLSHALPGSLMKLIATAAIKQENLLADNVVLECRGTVNVQGKSYHCQVAHGNLSLVEALGYSCNVFFAQAASKLASDSFCAYARAFGLADSVAGYPSGLFPARPQGSSQHYVLGLAEDMQPQPLQILRLSALIATRGNPPILHSADQMPPSTKAEPIHLNDATWTTLAEGMRLAARKGTAAKLDGEDKLQLAVKTGTTPHGKTFQSWITGYFPWQAPRYAFCLRSPVGTSHDAAVPQAHKFLFASQWP